MSIAKSHKIIISILFGLFTLLACKPTSTKTFAPVDAQSPVTAAMITIPASSATPQVTHSLIVSVSDAAATIAASIPTATPVPSATLTPTPSTTPTRVPAPVFDSPTTIFPEMFSDPQNDNLHDLILFESSNPSTFNSPMWRRQGTNLNKHGLMKVIPYLHQYIPLPNFEWTALWAFSPNGQSAGRIFQGEDKPFYLGIPPEPNLIVNYTNRKYATYLNSESFQPIQLPKECYDEQGNPAGCHSFTFSPDGRFLGMLIPPERCGERALILDTQKGEIVFREEPPVEAESYFSFEIQFISSVEMLVSQGHCTEGSRDVILIDLFKQTTTQICPLGQGAYWSPGQGACATLDGHPFGKDRYIISQNIETGAKYSSNSSYGTRYQWLPEGSQLIFQQWNVLSSGEETATVGTSQIYLLDTASATASLLLEDSSYDYYLCSSSEEDCFWHGDWIMLKRLDARVQTIQTWYGSDEPFDTCFFYAEDCPTQPERFALNYRTGELIPWDQAPLPSPTPTPTPIPSGPDLASQPIYTHPSGSYAFYVGLDGHSLWLVPQTGDPVLWVEDGSNFIYIP